MNHEDDCYSNVDVMLRPFAQLAVPPDVQQRLDARIEEFCKNSQPEKANRRSLAVNRTRRWWVGASVSACVAVVVSFLAWGSQDTWAQVVKTLQSKPWVRFTVQIPEGVTSPEDFEAPQHWFSNNHKVLAGKRGDRADFLDLERQELHFYNPHTESVTVSTSQDQHLTDFGFIETLRRLVSSEEKNDISLPKSAVQIVKQTEAEVQDEGRRWTEFTFQCRNPTRSPNEYQVIIRVDPESGLPVELRSTERFSPDQSFPEWRLAIDYPETGPADIYAMGVPKDAAIIDRRNVVTENGEEIKKFLAAYVAARQKPLGNSSVEMVQEVAGRIVPEEYQIELPGELMPHRVGYPNSLMGMGFSPVDNPDCEVTLDKRPVLGPPGTVLLHVLIETADGGNDCYYWIAPEKDYLVLRYEIHFSGKEYVEWNNLTRIVDQVKQSPEGRWYPAVVRYGRIKQHGDDLSNERLPRDSRPLQDRDPMEIGPVNTTLLRYDVKFAEGQE